MFQLDIKFQWHHKFENKHNTQATKNRPNIRNTHDTNRFYSSSVRRFVVQYLKITSRLDDMPQISCE